MDTLALIFSIISLLMSARVAIRVQKIKQAADDAHDRITTFTGREREQL